MGSEGIWVLYQCVLDRHFECCNIFLYKHLVRHEGLYECDEGWHISFCMHLSLERVLTLGHDCSYLVLYLLNLCHGEKEAVFASYPVSYLGMPAKSFQVL